MGLTIAHKKRFPYSWKLNTLGGRYSAKGVVYYENHKREIHREYDEILSTKLIRRELFGSSNKIHKNERYCL